MAAAVRSGDIFGDNLHHTLHTASPLPPICCRCVQVPALGWRKRDATGALGPYTWLTYAQAGDIRTSLGSGLLQLGLGPKASFGLYSVNCKEWVLLDAAVAAYAMVSVPLYDTLGPDAVEYIACHAELAAVGCSAAVLPTLMGCLPRCRSVRLLVSGAQWHVCQNSRDSSNCRSS